MKHSMTTLLAAGLLVAFAACDGGKTAPTKPSATTAAKKPAATGDSKTAAPKADEGDPKMDSVDVPTAEDYEDEADKKVTADNLEDELGRLEKEIDGDK